MIPVESLSSFRDELIKIKTAAPSPSRLGRFAKAVGKTFYNPAEGHLGNAINLAFNAWDLNSLRKDKRPVDEYGRTRGERFAGWLGNTVGGGMAINALKNPTLLKSIPAAIAGGVVGSGIATAPWAVKRMIAKRRLAKARAKKGVNPVMNQMAQNQ